MRTADTFLFISHTTNVLLFKFRYKILIGFTIIKEMSVSVASGTPCIILRLLAITKNKVCTVRVLKIVRGNLNVDNNMTK